PKPPVTPPVQPPKPPVTPPVTPPVQPPVQPKPPGPAILKASVGSLTFKDVTLGASASQELTITNSGAQPATFTSIAAGAPFTVEKNGCTAPIAPNGSCRLSVVFAPKAAGGANGTLTIAFRDNVAPNQLTVALSGNGVAP